MNQIVHFFTAISDNQRLLFSFICVLLFWNIETIAAFRDNARRWSHTLHNILYILPGGLIQFLMGFMFLKTIEIGQTHHWGLLFNLGITQSWAIFIVSFLLLDFCEYVYHVLTHKIPLFWRFHLVHHCDTLVDVTTTLREHPGETVLRLFFTTLWVGLTGTPLWAYFFRQIFQITFNFWVHSNFHLPKKLDYYLGFVFNTPNLHHIHHHHKQPFTDSNYADVLIIWDRLFGTFQRIEDEKLVYGLDQYPGIEQTWRFDSSLVLPFKPLPKLEDMELVPQVSKNEAAY